MTPKTEIELYLDRARQDLRAAQSNLEQGFYGVTVTRAYYAMFYAASALLSSRGISRSTHSGVISAFSQYLVKPGFIEVEYAKMLGHAFDSRLDSDYDIVFTPERALARDVLHDAHRFVDRAAKHLQQRGAL